MAGSNLAVAALIGIVMTGCAAALPSGGPATSVVGTGGTAMPSASRTATSTPASAPSAAPTAAPTPTPTPAPTVPAGPLPRTATVERDGVRVKLALERNPMPAGEWTTLTAEVTNTGRTAMTWLHDGCAITVHTWGEMVDSAWRPGIQPVGIAATFKGRALGIAYHSGPLRGPIIEFVPERWAGGGTFGCADMAIGDVIKPGEAIRQRYVWDGQARVRWGPPPSGPVTLTGTFAYYWRGRTQPEGDIGDRTLEVPLGAWIVNGSDSTRLSPPEVLDAALADPQLLAYLGTQDLGNGREEILWYRPELDAWEVGLLVWYDAPEPRMHVVLVDPVTGTVGDLVDRPWDEARDGFP